MSSEQQKNHRFILAGFSIWLAGLAAQIAIIGVYVVLIRSVQAAIHEFGWGNVPPERLSTFLWLSDNLVVLTVTPVVIATAAGLFVIYRLALILRSLKVEQHFGPGLTVGSMFIPFYSFYRPWAGLGEVRNTLTIARREGRLAEKGIRGANAATVVYGVSVFAYLAVMRLLDKEADLATPKGEFSGAAHYLAFLDQISAMFMVQIVTTVIFIAITSWYWLRTASLAKRVSMIRPASVEGSGKNEPLPTHPAGVPTSG
jgi:hypothetical protein